VATTSATEVVLICSEIGTRDYAPDALGDKQFRDVSDWLWKKYDEEISGWLRQRLTNMETPDRDRAPLRFDYTDQAGKLIPIDHAEPVSAIAQVSSQVQWHPQVVGGSYRQMFGMHAAEILSHPNYKNWSCVVKDSPGYGIRAVGPDPDNIVRTWTITPTADYPNSPPTVVSQPSYTNDICWRDGSLHYTAYSGTGGSPWQDVARDSANPLLSLMIELLQKYKLSI
jgi:hypothetical protein